MFEAPKSPYLVPFDGSFKVAEASTIRSVMQGIDPCRICRGAEGAFDRRLVT